MVPSLMVARRLIPRSTQILTSLADLRLRHRVKAHRISSPCGVAADRKKESIRQASVVSMTFCGLSARAAPMKRRFPIVIATRHSQVEISVVDHGPGIAAHELNGLFQEYGNVSTQSTKGEKRTGLGLAIAKRLVEAHGGTISVQTKQGVCTTFTVLLPIDALQ